MRTALLAGAMLIGLAAPSFAQTSSGQGATIITPRGQTGQTGAATEAELQGLVPMVGMRGAQMMGGGGGLGNAAILHAKHGEDEMAVRCPPHLQMNTCVLGVTKLMQNLQSLGNQSNETSQSGQSNQ